MTYDELEDLWRKPWKDTLYKNLPIDRFLKRDGKLWLCNGSKERYTENPNLLNINKKVNSSSWIKGDFESIEDLKTMKERAKNVQIQENFAK